ncbi:MAG: hypothetical protein GX575_33980 [Candidatus Anammoximicrobium sp.]|nr:hypothetical protein [Candidatus Anammoximicrobium sp.]
MSQTVQDGEKPGGGPLRVRNLSKAVVGDAGFLSKNVTEQSVSALGRMTDLRTLGVGGSGFSPNYRKTPAVERWNALLPNCLVDCED